MMTPEELRQYDHAVQALAMVNLDTDWEPSCREHTQFGPCILREEHPPAAVNEDGHVSRKLAMLCQQTITSFAGRQGEAQGGGELRAVLRAELLARAAEVTHPLRMHAEELDGLHEPEVYDGPPLEEDVDLEALIARGEDLARTYHPSIAEEADDGR
jgi:hypothetical protein